MFSALVLAVSVHSCSARPQLQLVAAVSRTQVAGRSQAFSASADATLRVRTVRRTPVSSDPGARAHAEGYYTIASRLTQTSHVRAFGATRAEAGTRLRRAVAAIQRDANAEYARQILVYETVTAHGRMQSQGPASGFPGGPNAAAYCAP